MVVHDHGQPRPDRPVGFVQHHHIQFGVIGLPQIVRMPGFPAQHQLVRVPVHRPVVVSQGQQPAVQTGDDLPDDGVRRRLPALLGGDLDRCPVNLGRVRRRPAKGHALDHFEQLIRQPVPVLVRSTGSTQPGCPPGEIGRQPPLGGPQRHPRRGRRLHQRDPVMHMRSQHGHPLIEGVAHRPQVTSPSSPSPSAAPRQGLRRQLPYRINRRDRQGKGGGGPVSQPRQLFTR